MKNVTIAKDLKFNGSKLTLEYKGEQIYKFQYSMHLDLYNIESCIYMLKRSFTVTDKNKFKDVVNHTVKYLENGVLLTIDSMFQKDNYPTTHEIYFLTIVKNSVVLV
jgi:hypothetical protein